MSKKPDKVVQNTNEILEQGISLGTLLHALQEMIVELASVKSEVKALKMLIQQYAQIRR